MRVRALGGTRAPAVALAVALAAAALAAPPAAQAAPGSAGPPFGGTGVVRTRIRASANAFATALVMQDDEQVVMAAGAGGDFGLARFNEYLYAGDVLGPVDGRVITDFGGTDDVARAVAVTASGRVVAAGSAGGDLAVARYDHDGVLDRSFDGDGRVTIDLGGPADSAFAVVPLADGRIVVAGGTQSTATVIRLLADGSPDPSFGRAGRVQLPSSGPGRAMALQPDGALLVAGGGDALALYRLLPGGALDSGFGAGGVASVGAGRATARAVVLGPDGTVTVAGDGGGDVVVARFGPSGQPDPTFGTAGMVVTHIGPAATGYGIARRADGALLVVGDAGDRGLLVRYRPDGALETGFGTGGFKVAQPNPVTGAVVTQIRAVLVHADGGWTVAGTGATAAMVGRVYEPTGTLVPSGVDFDHQFQQVTASATQPDGNVVAVVEAGGDVALVRYHPDGTRDTAFGVSGIVISDRANYPRAVAVQPNGRIVVAASVLISATATTAGAMTAAVVGFRPDGSLDTAFGTDGRTDVDLTGATQLTSGLAALPDGHLMLLGQGAAGATLARLTESGRLDTSWGVGGRVVGAFGGYPGSNEPLALQADGRMLSLTPPRGPADGPGVPTEPPALVRTNADGSLDRTFGVNGKVPLDSPDLVHPAAIAVQPDGRILVAGTTDGYDDATVVIRLLADGSRDPRWRREPAFFRRGTSNEPVPSSPSTLTVLGDGRVVTGGRANGQLALVRLQPDGAHDRTLGLDGLLMLADDLRPGAPPVAVVATTTAGTLVVATGNDGWPADVLLVRIATGQVGRPPR